jgi:hypothetical protein
MNNPPAGWYPDTQKPGTQRYWDGAQWTEHTAPLDTPPPPPVQPVEPAQFPIVGQMPGVYSIREDGKNGTVQVLPDRLVRTRKRTMGKDDVQMFPIKAVTGIQHDRKLLGTDLVRITFGSVSYEWKVSDAERFVAEVQSQMFAS